MRTTYSLSFSQTSDRIVSSRTGLLNSITFSNRPFVNNYIKVAKFLFYPL